MSSNSWPDHNPTAMSSSRTGKQSSRPSYGFENALNDETELHVFKQFQSSSAIQEILPGCDVRTEYQAENFSWKVKSADYFDLLLAVQDDSIERDKGVQSWNDVLKLIADAEDQYFEKGRVSWVRRKMRNGEDVAAVLQNLTDMIPEEKGLGILRAGLSILFTAWRGRIKNREKIFSALSDIPAILCVALQKWQFFKHDKQLRDATKQLIGDSIDAIRSLIEILVPNHTSRVSHWKQRIVHSIPEREEKEIEHVLALVDAAMKNVETNIERLDRTRAAETHLHARNTDAKTDAIQETLSGLETKFDSLREAFEQKMMAGYALIPQHMEFIKIPMVENCHTSFYQLVVEIPYKRDLQPLPAIAMPEPPIQPDTANLSAEQIVELLAVQPHSPYQDRDTVLIKGHTMSPVFLGRGRYVLATPQFQKLMSAPYSGLLLVDGDFQDESDGKVSPISVFCASLAAALAHNPAVMVLHFFAGQHSFPDGDPVRGPRGLVRSLIYQVLLYPNQTPLGLDQVLEQAVQDIANGDIDAMCWLLIELLKQVSNVATILCVVDNVSDFETRYEGWVEDLMRVFDWFRKVPGELGQDVYFKLLMTSSRKSTELLYKTDPSEHLSLVAGNVMNVGKSEWAMTEDIRSSVPPQGAYWQEGPEYSQW